MEEINKKFSSLVLAGAFFASVSVPSFTFFKDKWVKKTGNVQQRIEQKVQVGSSEVGVSESVKERVRSFIGRRAAVGIGKVIAKEGTTLTVSRDDKTYSVVTNGKTRFRRRFWGKSSLDEISVNNMVHVIGKWQNEEKTQIKAVLIRNLSVQKRYGVFFGVVSSVADGSFVMQIARRGEVTVTVEEGTKIVNRKMEEIVLSDIQNGHRVRVKGTWDNQNKTITETSQVKDFNIPIISSPSPVAE